MLFKHRSLEKVDTFIIYACILSAVASSAWLIYDLTFNKFELNGQEPIGKISLVKNHVKRKFNRSLVWYDVAKQETVYENDWIFTGSASETQIELNEGGQLTVDPDSLIILTKKNGNIKLNLQHGSLIANVSSDVEINVLKDGKLEQVESNKLSGPVKIVQNETIAKPVPKEKPPAPKKVAKEILIQYPSDFETVWVKEGEAVSLEWTPDKNIKKSRVLDYLILPFEGSRGCNRM